MTVAAIPLVSDSREDRRDRDQRQDYQGEHLRGLETERHAGQLRAEKDQDHAAGQAPHDGAEGGDADGGAGAALKRHRVAVEHRHGVGRRARDAERDGRDGSAVEAAGEDPDHHHDRALGRELVGERQQQGDGQGGGEAGDGADGDAQ